MFRASRTRCAILFLIAMVLVWPWPAAAGASGKAEAARPLAFDSWAFAVRVWAFLTGAPALAIPDNGCSVDPSGRCARGAAGTDLLDEGCSVDPSGGCRH